ncbi:MAG: ThuA domain-containing protein [Candidatus Latescibacterota bacterium]|nr:ThuA domain-containing protein [Candidatus Latescibacterota bacterium]
MSAARALVFVGTEGQYHDHAGHGRYVTEQLCRHEQIEAKFSQDYEILTDSLGRFDCVLFYTDVGAFTSAQEQGLLSFIEGGGGFFGLHTAAASFRESQPYHAMLNGFFDGHSKYMDFKVSVDDSHPISAEIADFSVTDELYYLKHDPAHSQHLMSAYDETKDETHVMAFHHTHGEGRVFYFALGHDMAVLENSTFLEIVYRGVLWTAKLL